MPTPTSRRDAGLALVALAALTWVAVAHPHLRLVDFISFSERAENLGDQLSHPLYPVGYPALLAGGHAVLGEVLLAGKILAVLAGLAAVAGGRWLGGAALGAFLLAQAPLLQHAATEGTDLPAAGLCLLALGLARERPLAAGAALAAACLCRYTAIAALPGVLWLSQHRARTLASFAVCTAPHWAVALAVDGWLLPDQSQNLRIGQGPDGKRWITSLILALRDTLRHPVAAAGALGLLVGSLRRDRRAGALLVFAALHLGGVALAFSNPRLVLPATLALSCGVLWLVPRGLLWWPAWVLLIWNLGPARQPSPQQEWLAIVRPLTADLEGRFAASEPWFYTEQGGWLKKARSLRQVGAPPNVTPERTASWAREARLDWLVLDAGRVVLTFPKLKPLLDGEPTEGLRLHAQEGPWRVYAVD